MNNSRFPKINELKARILINEYSPVNFWKVAGIQKYEITPKDIVKTEIQNILSFIFFSDNASSKGINANHIKKLLRVIRL